MYVSTSLPAHTSIGLALLGTSAMQQWNRPKERRGQNCSVEHVLTLVQLADRGEDTESSGRLHRCLPSSTRNPQQRPPV